jgi:hypothetical protein
MGKGRGYGEVDTNPAGKWVVSRDGAWQRAGGFPGTGENDLWFQP